MTRLGWYELLIYLMVVFTVTAIATVVAFAVSAEEPKPIYTYEKYCIGMTVTLRTEIKETQ